MTAADSWAIAAEQHSPAPSRTALLPSLGLLAGDQAPDGTPAWAIIWLLEKPWGRGEEVAHIAAAVAAGRDRTYRDETETAALVVRSR